MAALRHVFAVYRPFAASRPNCRNYFRQKTLRNSSIIKNRRTFAPSKDKYQSKKKKKKKKKKKSYW